LPNPPPQYNALSSFIFGPKFHGHRGGGVYIWECGGGGVMTFSFRSRPLSVCWLLWVPGSVAEVSVCGFRNPTDLHPLSHAPSPLGSPLPLALGSPDQAEASRAGVGRRRLVEDKEFANGHENFEVSNSWGRHGGWVRPSGTQRKWLVVESPYLSGLRGSVAPLPFG